MFDLSVGVRYLCLGGPHHFQIGVVYLSTVANRSLQEKCSSSSDVSKQSDLAACFTLNPKP